MDRVRGRQLLDHIQQVPPEQFNYGVFFKTPTRAFLTCADVNRHGVPQPGCGTAACLCGHAVWLWADEVAVETEFTIDRVQRLMQLSMSECQFLFLRRVGSATRVDAIRRLQHLLDGGAPWTYPWELEEMQRA